MPRLIRLPCGGSGWRCSTFLTPRMLARFGTRPVLATGRVLAGLGQLRRARLAEPGTYAGSVLPGILVTALGMSLGFPSTSIAATAGMRPGQQRGDHPRADDDVAALPGTDVAG